MEKKFLFGGATDLYQFTQEILREIAVYVAEETYSSIRLSSQLILIELLTNAIKHTGDSHSVIDLHIDEDTIRISRADNGLPFTISQEERVIYSDDLATLYWVPDSTNRCVFKIIEHDLDEPPSINKLSEHFGLMIITKASDQFTYCYDEEKGLNIFEAVLHHGNKP